MNVLHYYDATAAGAGAGFRRIVVTEPDAPVRRRVVAARATGSATSTRSPTRDRPRRRRSPRGAQPRPTFADGLHVQRVLAAVEASSAASSRWHVDGSRRPLRPTRSN